MLTLMGAINSNLIDFENKRGQGVIIPRPAYLKII